MSAIPSSSLPWYVGHNGATNLTRHEAQSFARQLLDSADYRDSLQKRIRTGDLPPAVETMLWHYAYGKPVEQVQLQVSTVEQDLSQLSSAELEQRAKELLDALREAREVEQAITATGTVQ
jgi:hypothetical protein